MSRKEKSEVTFYNLCALYSRLFLITSKFATSGVHRSPVFHGPHLQGHGLSFPCALFTLVVFVFIFTVT